MKHNSPKNCLAILGIMAFAASLSAQEVTWTDAGGTHNWKDGANWDTGSQPGSASTANIKNGGTAVIDTAVSSINYLKLGGTTLSRLNINSGGSLSVTGNGLTRIAFGASAGALTVDGGTLQSVGGISVGQTANATATLTIQNGGSAAATAVQLGNVSYTGITATLNIGGETASATAGWFNGDYVRGNSQTGAVNAINFNHTGTSTGSRYEFTKEAGSTTAVRILDLVAVNAKAGITVLTGSNTYTQGTTVKGGATLLANYKTASATGSSTGTGLLDVEANGVLGGTGYILGPATVSGTLRPGDYAFEALTPDYSALKFANDLTLNAGSTTFITLNGTTRGTDYSAVDVAGDLVLSGMLKIELGEEFSIVANQSESFNIFSLTGSVTGAYEGYLLPTTWNGLGLTWDTSGLSSDAFTGIASVTAIPEPSVPLLIVGAGTLVLIGHRRRVGKRGGPVLS